MAGPARILLASDGSRSAVRAATVLRSLRIAAGAQVRILTVLSSGTQPQTGWGEALADTRERAEEVEDLVVSATSGPKAELIGMASRIDVCSRYGNPADEILREVDEWGPDLVVMGSRGLRGPERWLLGSVSEHVVRRCKVPSLIVP